jgi:hypothetical protein
MYKDATAEKKNFLMIDLEADQRDRFRKGFNDIYEIEEEGEEETEEEAVKTDPKRS